MLKVKQDKNGQLIKQAKVLKDFILITKSIQFKIEYIIFIFF